VAGDELRYADAVALAERSLRIRERAFGPDSPLVAETLITLGASRLWLGDRDQAKRDNQRALSILEHSPGWEYMLSSPLCNLGELALDEGRFDDAKAMFERALAIDQESLGPDHPDLAFDYAGLGDAELGLGHASRAEPLLSKALRLLRGEPRAGAEIQFSLARARWILRKDRPGARAMAVKARDFFIKEPRPTPARSPRSTPGSPSTDLRRPGPPPLAQFPGDAGGLDHRLRSSRTRRGAHPLDWRLPVGRTRARSTPPRRRSTVRRGRCGGSTRSSARITSSSDAFPPVARRTAAFQACASIAPWR
jgi:tetratricopeptide (TPR) repeat protein